VRIAFTAEHEERQARAPGGAPDAHELLLSTPSCLWTVGPCEATFAVAESPQLSPEVPGPRVSLGLGGERILKNCHVDSSAACEVCSPCGLD
jgi:hypothetical protein